MAEPTSNFVRKYPASWESPSKDTGRNVESIYIQILMTLFSFCSPTVRISCCRDLQRCVYSQMLAIGYEENYS